MDREISIQYFSSSVVSTKQYEFRKSATTDTPESVRPSKRFPTSHQVNIIIIYPSPDYKSIT